MSVNPAPAGLPEIDSCSLASPFVRWRVADRFKIVPVGGGEYRFVSISQNIGIRLGTSDHGMLSGLLELLEQGRSRSDLVEFAGSDRETELSGILSQLASRGLIEQIPVADDDGFSPEELLYYASQRKFFSNFQLRGNEPPVKVDGVYQTGLVVAPQKRLKQSSVLIVGSGQTGVHVSSMLARAGVGRIFGAGGNAAMARTIEAANPFVAYSVWPREAEAWPETPGLLVLCEEGFDPAYHEAINLVCLARNIPWISRRSVGLRCEIGPWIVPHETACYHCMELRKSANIRLYDDSIATQQALVSSGTTGALSFPLGCEVLALEVVKILSGFSRPMTYGTMFTFDLVSLECRLHAVLKVPRCSACAAGKQERPSVNIWRPGSDFEDF